MDEAHADRASDLPERKGRGHRGHEAGRACAGHLARFLHTGQITTDRTSETTPNTTHTRAELAWTRMNARHVAPARAMPAPTPANTVLSSRGRRTGSSRARHQADTQMSTQALAMPASARRAIQIAKLSCKPIPSVARPIVTSPPRIARAARIRTATTDSAPSRYPG